MLLSMTGYGEGRSQAETLGVSLEVKSVNNRHLKVSVRLPEAFSSFESEFERIVREFVTRGTVSIFLRVDRGGSRAGYQIDTELLREYHDQFVRFATETGIQPPQDAAGYLALPGVVRENSPELQVEDEWPLIEAALREALERHRVFRQTEGKYMEDELRGIRDTILRELEKITEVAPQVVVDYRDRLLQRVNQLLQTSSLEMQANDVLREVSLFADRCDITEEIARLRSHLAQFASVLDQDQSQGRQLEFLGQEMFREINTIGSKANSVAIAHSVVEMKASIEKMREILQNVE